MARDDDMPEGSVASRVLEARDRQRSEARQANACLEDPPTPCEDSPAALVLGSRRSRMVAGAAAMISAVVFHVGLVGVAVSFWSGDESREQEAESREPMEVKHVVDLDQPEPEPEPKPEPEPEPEPVEETPKPEPKPQPSKPEPASKPPEKQKPPSPSESDSEASKSDSSNSKPAAAKAGEVVDAKADSKQVADFTGMPSGEADSFAGGVTAPSGKSDEAVRAEEVDPDGAVRKGEGASEDSGRAIGLDRTDWECPWPKEAEDLSVDEQTVVLRAVVAPDGSPKSVSLVSDPGFGFGETALECARQHEFQPALDEDGEPYTATSPPIRVRFTR